MARFFIDRPIFAWVIALFIVVIGTVAITQLPIAQYPPVAPPSIVVSAAYPGASAKTLEDSVLSVIEREMNGSPGLIYMESVAQADGSGNITLSFQPGTNPDLAQVDVQNRLSRAAPRIDPRLVEMDFGSWEMRRWDDIARAEIDAWAADLVHYRPGGGDSVLRMAQRVAGFYADLQRQQADAIVVCHAGTIRLLAACHAGLAPADAALQAARTPHAIAYGAALTLES